MQRFNSEHDREHGFDCRGIHCCESYETCAYTNSGLCSDAEWQTLFAKMILPPSSGHPHHMGLSRHGSTE
jgi:hypothetical protein